MAREPSQLEYDVRCEWGGQGIELLAPASDVVVIVDVFSFSTSVDIATARGATVYPYAWGDDSAAAFAESVGAELAGKNERGLSLKPSTLENVPLGCRLVLPSPNGSSLSTTTGAVPTLTGCFRNSRVVCGGCPAPRDPHRRRPGGRALAGRQPPALFRGPVWCGCDPPPPRRSLLSRSACRGGSVRRRGVLARRVAPRLRVRPGEGTQGSVSRHRGGRAARCEQLCPAAPRWSLSRALTRACRTGADSA